MEISRAHDFTKLLNPSTLSNLFYQFLFHDLFPLYTANSVESPLKTWLIVLWEVLKELRSVISVIFDRIYIDLLEPRVCQNILTTINAAKATLRVFVQHLPDEVLEFG